MTTYQEILRFLQRPDVTGSLVVVVVWLVFHFVLRTGLRRSNLDLDQKFRIRQLVLGIGWLMVLLFLISIWFEVLRNVAVAMAAFAMAFVLSFKDLINNIVGYFYRGLSNAYNIGDRIQVGGLRGDVLATRVMSTTLMEVSEKEGQSTGRLLIMPHALLLAQPILNETKYGGFQWCEIPVQIKDTADLKRCQQALEDTARPYFEEYRDRLESSIRDLQEDYSLKVSHMEPKVYISAEGDKTILTLRLAILPRSRRDSVDSILRGYFRRVAASAPPANPETADTPEKAT